MREALQTLGFYDVEETAIGATIVKNEYERILREEEKDVLISSCCHSINLLIQKYFPSELKYLADVVSPMQAHCQDIKKRIPNAKTVFVGPCVAKKDEAEYYEGICDAVLTFEELTEWLKEENIELEAVSDKDEFSRARFFPTTGGVLKTMTETSDYTYVAIDGVENCIQVLKDINFTAYAGEILGIAAIEGNGQSQLINAITGMGHVSSGSIELSGNNITGASVRKIRGLKLEETSEKKLLKDIEKLRKQPFGSAEAAVLRNYLDTVLELPWKTRTKERVDVAAARKILERAEYCGVHFGAKAGSVRSEQVKNRLLFEIPELRWAGVNTTGCTAVITVAERQSGEVPAEDLPGDLCRQLNPPGIFR